MTERIKGRENTPADAAAMLAQMSPENYQALITIIEGIYDSDKTVLKNKKLDAKRKRDAFLEMEKMRKETWKFYGSSFDPEKEYAEAIEEKYGCID